jgi:sortase A
MLETLAPGDRLRIERVDGRVAFFAVTDIRIVDSRTTRIALDAEEPRLTLVTCYPFNAIRPGGPLRFVVTADLLFIGKNRLRRFFRDPASSPAAKSVVFAAYPDA